MSFRRGIGVKRGCELCRLAHAKCDKKHPKCNRCTWLGKKCVREPAFRFLNCTDEETDERGSAEEGHFAFEYARDQIWVEAPREVEFILESPDSQFKKKPGSSTEAFSSSKSGNQSLQTSPESSRESSLLPNPAQSTDAVAHVSDEDESQNRAESSQATASPGSGGGFLRTSPDRRVADALFVTDCNTTTVSDLGSTTASETGQLTSSSASESSLATLISPRRDFKRPFSQPIPLAPLYGHSETRFHDSPWRLEGPDEAMFIRYFVTNLSPLFDYCDPERSFSTTVVQRAVCCSTLLLAILAVSSRYLSLTSGHDSYLADQYHRECLALLIPMLNDSSTLLDEAIWAATVILRFFEEISVSLVGRDTQSHLLGAHIFVRAQEYRASGIRQAAFRVALRQEITVAFSSRRPVQLLTEYVKVDRSSDPRSDWSWTFRIIVLCAETLNHCYCQDVKESLQPWADLASRVESWLHKKPPSFEPLRCIERNHPKRVFPEIWFLNDCHVAGQIYYLMCHILLTAYDPRKPRLGPGRVEARRLADELIKEDVRKICGIALSNPHAVPSMFKASAVIGICGDLFTDRIEQQALLDLLLKTQVELAWPTAESQNYLRERWGWI